MGQAATATLIGVGRIGKPIAEHHLAPRQRWTNDFGQMLCTRGKHQQQLGVSAHGLVAGCQQQLAYTLGQRCTARLAGQQYLNTLRTQLRRQVITVGAFACTFRAFKSDKQTSHSSSLIVIIAHSTRAAGHPEHPQARLPKRASQLPVPVWQVRRVPGWSDSPHGA